MREFHYNYYKGASFWTEKDRWIFDNKSKPDLITYKEMKDIFTKGYVYDHKNNAPMCNFCEWVEDPIYVEDTKTGKSFIKKTANNVKSVSALLLDFDHGISIQEFKEKYGHITHIGYTSYNHTVKTPEYDRFRVVIPLTENIPVELFKDQSGDHIIPSLTEFFDSVDPVSWDVSRGFFLPGFPKGKESVFETWVNDAEIFDWHTLEVTTVPVKEKYVPKNNVVKGGSIGNVLLETLDVVGLFQSLGLYKGHRSGNVHDVTCPRHHEHTDGKDDGCCIMEQSSSNHDWWGFRCLHSHGLAGEKASVKWLRQTLIEDYGNDVFRPYCDVEEVVKPVFEKHVPKKSVLDIEVTPSELSIIESFKANPFTHTSASTGSGKSYATAHRALEIIEQDEKARVFIFVTSRDQIKQFVLLFGDVLQLDKIADAGIDYVVSGGGFAIGQNVAEDRVRDAAKIVITHHGYVGRRGFYDRYFSIFDYIDENSYVFIDEVDSYIESITQPIRLGTRYKQFTMHGVKNYVNVARCPLQSGSGNCMNCTMKRYMTRLTYDTTDHVYKYEPITRFDQSQTFTEYDWVDIDAMEVAKYHVDNNLEVLTLRQNDDPSVLKMVTSCDEDKDRVVNVSEIIQDMIDASWRPTVYRNRIWDDNTNCEISTDDMRFNYGNAVENTMEIPQHIRAPYYACGSLEIVTMDRRPLTAIAQAKEVHTMTATLSPNQANFLKDMMPELVEYNILPSDGQKMDEIVVLGTSRKYIDLNNLDYITELKKALIFQPTKNAASLLAAVMSKNIDNITLGVSGVDYHKFNKNNVESDIDILISHSRGTLGRGINLPQYNWVFVNARTYKPISSFSMIGDMELLHEARSYERAGVFIQNIGRILRKMKDGTDSGKRYIVIDMLESEDEFNCIVKLLGRMANNVSAVWMPQWVKPDAIRDAVLHVNNGSSIESCTAPITLDRLCNAVESLNASNFKELLTTIPFTFTTMNSMEQQIVKDTFNSVKRQAKSEKDSLNRVDEKVSKLSKMEKRFIRVAELLAEGHLWGTIANKMKLERLPADEIILLKREYQRLFDLQEPDENGILTW